MQFWVSRDLLTSPQEMPQYRLSHCSNLRQPVEFKTTLTEKIFTEILSVICPLAYFSVYMFTFAMRILLGVSMVIHHGLAVVFAYWHILQNYMCLICPVKMIWHTYTPHKRLAILQSADQRRTSIYCYGYDIMNITRTYTSNLAQ